jgi:hypothetical protein
MRAGSTYYFWWKEKLSDPWQSVAACTMAGADRFTNHIAVFLTANPRPGFVGTNELSIEVTNTPTRFFMISTNEAGSLTVPIVAQSR